MQMTRRNFTRILAGAGATAALAQFGGRAAFAADNFRAMVGVFLLGGNDGWNMVIPTDGLHPQYLASRGSVGIPLSALSGLGTSGFALHPAMNALRSVWDEGSLGLVLNAGTLTMPTTKTLYQTQPQIRPSNLMSHSDEQAHWQGMRAQGNNSDGFMGRMLDRTSSGTVPGLISFAGNQLALIGHNSRPLVLPSTGTLARRVPSSNAAGIAINAGVDAFSNASGTGTLTETSAQTLTDAYAMVSATSSVLAGSSSVEAYFVDENGTALTSEIANQLKRVARMIEARNSFGHARQTFLVSHGSYDTHNGQVGGTDRTGGTHGALLRDLALALAAFNKAMRALGLAENVTTFTMSDFGRVYKGNAQSGTDHAWGSNHLVMGGALNPATVHGRYPDPTLGGIDDIGNDGRFIPTTSQEEYVGAIARWHGVSDNDMPYVFPNWSTWLAGGRGRLNLFRN